jgi:DNA polymerase III subunit epsilon
MKILVFDTETTGLPIGKNPSIVSTEMWPYIVQLSYILYDNETNMVLDYVDRIIKLPKGIKITQGSQDIHKITNEICDAKGVDIKQELIDFNNAILNSDVIVAHNISFDKRMIMVECIRHKIRQNFTINTIRKLECCTMKSSVDICKIVAIGHNGAEYFKYPKLMELHKHLFNTIPDGLHNSMIDVLACLRCYGKLNFNIDYNEVSQSLKMLNGIYKGSATN